ncbi:MAG: NYN domain-containing protein [Candidatus Thorarchaeota archaeon]
MTSSETPPNLAVFWDIENVHDVAETHEAMTKKIHEEGTVIKAFAFADWDNRRDMAERLYSLGYELIHVPDSRDNASDYKMAAYILEHLVRYPETNRYVMISGDGDFKLIAGALRERGLDLWVISNPIITASDLTDLATTYSDIFSFKPTNLDCTNPEDCEFDDADVGELRRIAAAKLQEVIKAIENTGNQPGVGHAKHVMTALNPSFNEHSLGFRLWNEFLDWAVENNYITREGELPGTILRLPSTISADTTRISKEAKSAYQLLCSILSEKLDNNMPPTLDAIADDLKDREFDHSSLGYSKLADFVLSAEKRGLVRVLPTDIESDTPIIMPLWNMERVKSWFEENHEQLFGTSVNIPKDRFLSKISEMLVDTRTTMNRLETYLQDPDIVKKYKIILEASQIPFLPPFQMSMAHVLLGKGFSCTQTVERVNKELEPLGITLQCS